MDYEPLVAGAVGTDVILDRNSPRMCLDITLIDDSIVEGSENLMARFNFDPVLGALVDGNFRFDPNVTEVVIQDMDGEIKLITIHDLDMLPFLHPPFLTNKLKIIFNAYSFSKYDQYITLCLNSP